MNAREFLSEAKRKVMGAENAEVIELRPRREKRVTRACNLCNSKFVTHSKFERFCAECKQADELYHFHDWLVAC